MRKLRIVGYLGAGIMLAVAVLHIGLGFKSVRLLGVVLPERFLVDPVLDSQDRFYGAMLGGLGLLLIHALGDVARYRGVLVIIAWTMIVGGFARLIGVVATGWPPPIIVVFILFELVMPTLLLKFLATAARD